MPTANCTIGISIKERISKYGQVHEVFKPIFLCRIIHERHFKNEYDRIKKAIEGATITTEDARVEIIDKASGKCQAVFNIETAIVDEIIRGSKMYFAVRE